MILLALALQAADTPTDTRYKACLDLATSNPEAARNEAERFRLEGGGARARQCLGLAYAQQERWRDAAIAFEAAAQEAAKDPLASRYWAQAGNAWLAAGEPVKAYAALNAALAAGTLTGQDEGEALLDRARSLVAAGQLAGARADLDAALVDAPKDPLAWLLSATLARRMKDVPRAQLDIGEALKLSADDASVQLEAGNIAAMSGNADAARAAWELAVKIAPTSPAGQNARAALGQFDTPAPAPAPAPAPPAK
jgi:tetratricopeptide (TPR) repeat protein